MVEQPRHSQPQPSSRVNPWGNAFQEHLLNTQPSENGRLGVASPPLQHSTPPRQRQQAVMPIASYNTSYHPISPAAFQPFQAPYYAPLNLTPSQYHQAENSIHAEQVRSGAVSIAAETPLTEDQEVLARTAQTFLAELDTDPTILQANPKLANSNFMQLLRGLGDKDVVIQEGKPVEGDEVGQGATFINRSEVFKDWAADFVSESQRNNLDEPSTMGCIPFPPQVSSSGQMSWDRQFQDQEALIQSSRPVPAQRRKSVHFNDQVESQALGPGVPASLAEALNSLTAIPGAQTSWQENSIADDTDFDEEAFMLFNGSMKQAASPRIGIGAMESWGDLQKDWEDFRVAEHTTRGKGTSALRGMGMGDEVERYMFQSGNPYQAGIVDIDQFGRESPTVKVSSEILYNRTS
jgi:peroxin-5